MFDQVGEVTKKRNTKRERAQCKKTTEAGRMGEMGMGHEPLGLQELMKAQFIAFTVPHDSEELTRDWATSHARRHDQVDSP